MNDQIPDHSFNQEDDISILPSEDDVASMSPHVVVPYFNLTASRHQLPSTSGISSMEALRNAYEELKKKYNDLNLKYQAIYSFVRKNHRAEFIPDELTQSGSHSLEEKSKMLQMSRKDEIEKLHNAILRLNHELSEEKSKNIKLQVQINSYKEMPQPTSVEAPNEKSLHVLDDLRKNVEMLERSVEFHKAVISKQLPHSKRVNQPHFGKSDYISQRKQQSEHDELSSLGNKLSHSPMKSAANVATIPTDQPQTAVWLLHNTDDVKTPQSIVDLKNFKRKQEKPNDNTQTMLASPQHMRTLPPPQPSSTLLPKPAPTTTTTNSDTNALVRQKDTPYLHNAEAFSSANGSDQSLCVSEMLCPICEKPFTDLDKFQEHVFDCKSDPLEQSCPVCMKNFKNSTQEQFVEHVHTHFPDDRAPDDFDVLNFSP